MFPCKNIDITRGTMQYYDGKESSPLGFGFSALGEDVGTVMKGRDGNYWMVHQKSGVKLWGSADEYNKKLFTKNVSQEELERVPSPEPEKPVKAEEVFPVANAEAEEIVPSPPVTPKKTAKTSKKKPSKPLSVEVPEPVLDTPKSAAEAPAEAPVEPPVEAPAVKSSKKKKSVKKEKPIVDEYGGVTIANTRRKFINRVPVRNALDKKFAELYPGIIDEDIKKQMLEEMWEEYRDKHGL